MPLHCIFLLNCPSDQTQFLSNQKNIYILWNFQAIKYGIVWTCFIFYLKWDWNYQNNCICFLPRLISISWRLSSKKPCRCSTSILCFQSAAHQNMLHPSCSCSYVTTLSACLHANTHCSHCCRPPLLDASSVALWISEDSAQSCTCTHTHVSEKGNCSGGTTSWVETAMVNTLTVGKRWSVIFRLIFNRKKQQGRT